MKNKHKSSHYSYKNLRDKFLTKKNIRRFNVTYKVCWNLFLLFIISSVIAVAFAIGTGAGFFAATVKDEPLRSEEQIRNQVYDFEQTSEVYFANDVYLGKLRTDLEREIVELEEVSPYIVDAVVATEDENFYTHSGVVPKSIARAGLQEITNSENQSGGSTITQQVVKMQMLTNEQSFDRKFKEILLAQRVENVLSKDEIMEVYLNIAPFGRNSNGHNIAGIQTAAQGIFGVDAKDVNLPQAAYLAGLPNSPSAFTPYTNTPSLKEDLSPGLNRMQLVLKRMYQNGAITEQAYKDALAYDITKDFVAPTPAAQNIEYPYVMAEAEERSIEILTPIVAEKDGYTKEDLAKDPDLEAEYTSHAETELRQGGYKIYTTIDKGVYDAMQLAVADFNSFQPSHQVTVTNPETGQEETVNEPVECGAILIDNDTGRIISFVGGRDFQREQLNHATDATRSNGSTMKPLLVYAPAMEMGVGSPGKPLVNVPVAIPTGGGEPYKPTNYGNSGYTGVTTTREAIKRSYNIPAVVQYEQIVDSRPATYLEKMGITTLEPDDYTNLSTSIGGLTNGVTVEENVNAYVTFANDGQFVDAYMIEKIVDRDGNVVFQQEVTPVEVFSPETAFMMRDCLRDVIDGGTAAGLESHLDFQSDWVGKTGTGQDYKDSWLVASNPSVTFGTWMGYDTPASLQRGGLSYSQRNSLLWADLVNAAYGVNPEAFTYETEFPPMPDGIVKATFPGTGNTDYFNKKFLPENQGEGASYEYVELNGKKYAATAATPREFVSSGSVIPENSLADMGYEFVIDKSAFSAKAPISTGSVEQLPMDGTAPNGVNAAIYGQQLTWSSSDAPDVVGYYIYNGQQLVQTVKADSALSYNIPDGAVGDYFVFAVDNEGIFSPASNPVTFAPVAVP